MGWSVVYGKSAARLGKRSSRGKGFALRRRRRARRRRCEQGLRNLLEYPATLSAFQYLPSLRIDNEFTDLRLPSCAWRGKPHWHEPSNPFPHLEDWFINREILPTIEHQTHIRSLLGNIGRNIETRVNLDFYVYAGVSWQCYSPNLRCHNSLSFSYELLTYGSPIFQGGSAEAV